MEPVPHALLALLRQAVLDHATTEHRRVYPARIYVGAPGQVTTSLEVGELALDQALRADLLEAMVRRVRRPGPDPLIWPLIWLARPGELDVQDIDLAWLAAARTAEREMGLTLLMVVINRRSWRDPSTGVGRSWQRLR